MSTRRLAGTRRNKHLPIARRTRQRLAAEAGARGVSAAPMTHRRRLRAYFAQRPRLTRRQQRQLIRMEYRAGFAQSA